MGHVHIVICILGLPMVHARLMLMAIVLIRMNLISVLQHRAHIRENVYQKVKFEMISGAKCVSNYNLDIPFVLITSKYRYL